MPCEKMRSRAMELVAGAPGVSSVAVTGDDKDRLEVIGDGVDSVCLVRCLRKKIGHACIVQVEVVKDKKPGKDEPKPPMLVCHACPPVVCPPWKPPIVVWEDQSTCSVM
ncbi:hypothetical protein ABZP36_007122 [Zizania latifolia]